RFRADHAIDIQAVPILKAAHAFYEGFIDHWIIAGLVNALEIAKRHKQCAQLSSALILVACRQGPSWKRWERRQRGLRGEGAISGERLLEKPVRRRSRLDRSDGGAHVPSRSESLYGERRVEYDLLRWKIEARRPRVYASMVQVPQKPGRRVRQGGVESIHDARSDLFAAEHARRFGGWRRQFIIFLSQAERFGGAQRCDDFARLR